MWWPEKEKKKKKQVPAAQCSMIKYEWVRYECYTDLLVFIAIWIFFLSCVNGMYVKIDKDHTKGGDKACLWHLNSPDECADAWCHFVCENVLSRGNNFCWCFSHILFPNLDVTVKFLWFAYLTFLFCSRWLLQHQVKPPSRRTSNSQK